MKRVRERNDIRSRLFYDVGIASFKDGPHPAESLIAKQAKGQASNVRDSFFIVIPEGRTFADVLRDSYVGRFTPKTGENSPAL